MRAGAAKATAGQLLLQDVKGVGMLVESIAVNFGRFMPLTKLHRRTRRYITTDPKAYHPENHGQMASSLWCLRHECHLAIRMRPTISASAFRRSSWLYPAGNQAA